MMEFITTPYAPCISYEWDFDPDKGEKYNIQVDYTKSTAATVTGQPDIKKILTQKRTLQKFEGSSAEELLYTFDNFTILAKDLNMMATEKWSEFPKILHHGLKKEWNFIISQQNPLLNKTSHNDQKLAFKAFLEIYPPVWIQIWVPAIKVMINFITVTDYLDGLSWIFISQCPVYSLGFVE